MDIKIESERIFTLCHGCLSADRKVVRITDQNKALFLKLRDDFKQSQNETKELQLCWECNAIINKLKEFQDRIKTAQDRLIKCLQTFCHKDEIHSLSHLKTKHTNNYDHKFVYEEVKYLRIEQKELTLKEKEIIELKDVIHEKETDLETLLDVKEENNVTIIKDEYDNTNLDNDINIDYYEPELKIETDIDFIVDRKPTKSEIKKLSIKNYEQYATVTNKSDMYKKKVSLYYQTVFLTEKEIEDILGRERRTFGYKRMPFKCTVCVLGYKRRLDLLRHTSLHHRKSQFPTRCAACKRQVHSLTDLEEHWKQYHTPMLRCSLCSELCRSKGEMRKHLNRRHTKTYTCNICHQQLSTLRDFSNHYIKVHERVVCDYCNSSYTSKRRLEVHIRRNHLPAHCTVCNKTYRTYHVFENHVKTYHPELFSCDTRQELCYCVECDKQYPSVYRYRRHLQQSARHRPRKKIRVPCPDCGKIFTRTAYMNNHYRQIHMKDTKHYCDLCNKHFATAYGARKHTQYVHQKLPMPKDKICDLCGKGFSTNRILTNHRRTHTGERPFKCKYCPSTFAQDSAMRTHQKTQHKNIIQLTS